LATKYRKKLDIQVVGITGSNGKTTTKDIVYSLLSAKAKTLKTEGKPIFFIKNSSTKNISNKAQICKTKYNNMPFAKYFILLFSFMLPPIIIY